MEPLPAAPPVVVVVVTCDPGPWLEPALISLADQDYPNLSVLVVDAASRIDPTPRVGDVLPGAFVLRLTERVGFARSSNQVLEVVEGASHYLFCHDDVVLDPDAIRQLVEEAYRSNAGVVSPKMVEWDRPDRLLAVGAGADRFGVVHPLVDPGELDQEQHDAVRDVFVAPGGVTLVRADLFRALGGFDPDIDLFGEDLDFSWRAQLAGARVLVAPAARVRHLQAMETGLRPGWASARARHRIVEAREEHRLATVLTCYSVFSLLWIVPLVVLGALTESAWLVVRGRPRAAIALVRNATGPLRRPRRLWSARRRAQRHRTTPDRELRRLQSRGNARFRAFLRARIDGARLADLRLSALGAPALADEESAAAAVRDSRELLGGSGGGVEPSGRPPDGPAPMPAPPAGARRAPRDTGTGVPPSMGGGGWRLPVGVALVVATVVVVGSRSLLGPAIPAVGQLPVLSGGEGEWGRLRWSWWRPDGLGSFAAAPPALAFLGVGATVLVGAVGTLQHLVILGPLLVGPVGAYRAARPFGSLRGRVAAMVTYATVPVAYNALGQGRWSGLLAYAAAPWVLAMISRLSGAVPYPPIPSARIAWRVVGTGILVAVVGAFVPSFLFVVPVIGIGLLAGSMLCRQPSPGARCVVVAALSAAVAVVLLLPWSADALRTRVAAFGMGPGQSGRLGLGEILRFHTGAIGRGPLGWALLAAAALPLVIGRSWRLAWAARLWCVALACWLVTWTGLRGWLADVPLPSPEVFLASAAAALAGAVALGAVAFELDLPGYRFGWRQLASGAAAVALFVAALPVLDGAMGGRWHLPDAGASAAMAFLPDTVGGDYRVLWVGAPQALPLGSWFLEPGVGYATSFDGDPDVTDLWVSSHHGATELIADDLRLAGSQQTTKLGHLLAPMAVRYIVVPNHNAPAGSGATAVAVPQDVINGLELQTDLQSVSADLDYTVYLNAAWAPAQALLDPRATAAAATVPGGGTGVAAALSGNRRLQEVDLTGAKPVLTGDRADPRSGRLPTTGNLYVASTRHSGWTLDVAGHQVKSQPAFGWAMRFAVPTAGAAALRVTTPLGARLAQIVEVIAWVVATLGVLVDRRRRRIGGHPAEIVEPGWFEPMSPGTGYGSWRRPVRTTSAGGPADLDSDELWADV